MVLGMVNSTHLKQGIGKKFIIEEADWDYTYFTSLPSRLVEYRLKVLRDLDILLFFNSLMIFLIGRVVVPINSN